MGLVSLEEFWVCALFSMCELSVSDTLYQNFCIIFPKQITFDLHEIIFFV